MAATLFPYSDPATARRAADAALRASYIWAGFVPAQDLAGLKAGLASSAPWRALEVINAAARRASARRRTATKNPVLTF